MEPTSLDRSSTVRDSKRLSSRRSLKPRQNFSPEPVRKKPVSTTRFLGETHEQSTEPVPSTSKFLDHMRKMDQLKQIGSIPETEFQLPRWLLEDDDDLVGGGLIDLEEEDDIPLEGDNDYRDHKALVKMQEYDSNFIENEDDGDDDDDDYVDDLLEEEPEPQTTPINDNNIDSEPSPSPIPPTLDVDDKVEEPRVEEEPLESTSSADLDQMGSDEDNIVVPSKPSPVSQKLRFSKRGFKQISTSDPEKQKQEEEKKPLDDSVEAKQEKEEVPSKKKKLIPKKQKVGSIQRAAVESLASGRPQRNRRQPMQMNDFYCPTFSFPSVAKPKLAAKTVHTPSPKTASKVKQEVKIKSDPPVEEQQEALVPELSKSVSDSPICHEVLVSPVPLDEVAAALARASNQMVDEVECEPSRSERISSSPSSSVQWVYPEEEKQAEQLNKPITPIPLPLNQKSKKLRKQKTQTRVDQEKPRKWTNHSLLQALQWRLYLQPSRSQPVEDRKDTDPRRTPLTTTTFHQSIHCHRQLFPHQTAFIDPDFQTDHCFKQQQHQSDPESAPVVMPEKASSGQLPVSPVASPPVVAPAAAAVLSPRKKEQIPQKTRKEYTKRPGPIYHHRPSAPTPNQHKTSLQQQRKSLAEPLSINISNHTHSSSNRSSASRQLLSSSSTSNTPVMSPKLHNYNHAHPRYPIYGAAECGGRDTHLSFFQRMHERKKLNVLAIGLNMSTTYKKKLDDLERPLVQESEYPEEYFYKEILMKPSKMKEQQPPKSPTSEEECSQIDVDGLDISQFPQDELISSNPAEACARDVLLAVKSKFAPMEEDNWERNGPDQASDGETDCDLNVLLMHRANQEPREVQEHLVFMLKYIFVQRLTDISTHNVIAGTSMFYSNSLANANRLRESLKLYSKQRLASILVAHNWLLERLNVYLLAAYLNLLRFLKVAGSGLSEHLVKESYKDKHKDFERANEYIKEF
uniref:Protein lilliputian n=1 Tax=Ditylenchus dipsaci TaxID=166011 RepID=A0A915D112_9BILA